jgi:hypothetical protein
MRYFFLKLRLIDVKDFCHNVKNEGFFTDILIELVNKFDFAVHLMAELPAHVEAQTRPSSVDFAGRLKSLIWLKEQ